MRQFARRLRGELRLLGALRGLPWPVARFQWRAHRLALRTGDEFSLASATRPAKLGCLLAAAAGRRQVVELGTATAWTTLSLLLADPDRRVRSLDLHENPRRSDYLRLVAPDVLRRAELVAGPGRSAGGTDIELLYVDSSHERAETVAEIRAWWPHLAPDAVIVFDDFDHPDFPGVREAVRELGLAGEAREGLWIHRRDGGSGLEGAEALEDPA